MKDIKYFQRGGKAKSILFSLKLLNQDTQINIRQKLFKGALERQKNYLKNQQNVKVDGERVQSSELANDFIFHSGKEHMFSKVDESKRKINIT